MTNTTTTLDVLIGARQLISKPDGWIKHHAAGVRFEDGGVVPTGLSNPRANCFCSIGAIATATCPPGAPRRDPREHLYRTARDRLVEAVISLSTGHVIVSEFNDDPDTDHAKVLRVFDLAIEIERAAQGGKA